MLESVPATGVGAGAPPARCPAVSVHILAGDCREVLPTLPEGSVHCVVTSPPYWGLRDYGVAGQLGLEPAPEEYVESMVAVFREVRRVLRDDGTVWLNMGDGYTGTATPGGPLGLKRDGRTEAGRAATVERERARRMEECLPVKAGNGLKPKDLVGMPWRLAFALQADGWYLRADIVWAKPNPMPESVTDRPTKAHEYVFLLTKSARYFYDAEAVREPASDYTAHTNGRGVDVGGKHDRTRINGNVPTPMAGRNLRSVWTIPSAPFPEAHFATFPPALASRCIQAGSRMGDTVLDPFAGSGTVGAVAERLGRHSVLVELSPEYVAMAKRRTAQLGLFAQAAPV